jgi:hypothetical protein
LGILHSALIIRTISKITRMPTLLPLWKSPVLSLPYSFVAANVGSSHVA